MGNQEKQRKEIRDGNPHASFQGRVLKIQRVKKENPCSTPVVVLSLYFGRTPTIEEYKAAVKGINLTQFAPSHKIIGKLAK
jgi:aconitate hydratase 2/2-methylisocitrate dehydratase